MLLFCFNIAKLGYYFVFVFANSNFCSTKQHFFPYAKHQLSLISATTLFLSQQPTSNSTTYCYQHVHFFLQLFVKQQPIQLIFQQSACQPNHFISTQQFYFLVFYVSSLKFFGQTCHFYAKSSGGAM